ncbi:hypothetical protein [Pseudoalteromonas phenolica]|uniref:hypothetical protein n=1 Tax=Pseudoalteromonas phenolica TaxID=161398 RepID=UPI001F4F51F1|nr:hypothetical protein [Pseudoalteromonas phenolica]
MLSFTSHFFDLSHPLFAQYQAGIWPHVDVNHLWYLRSLWQFTLLLVLMLPVLQSCWLHKGIERFFTVPCTLGVFRFTGAALRFETLMAE